MSESNGVIRIGRKGIKKFAFGEDGPAFEVEVVEAFHEWVNTDGGFRDENRIVKDEDIASYHEAAVKFVTGLSKYKEGEITKAEALDFIARLREEYDKLATFFQPKSPEKLDSPATTGSELTFSAEDS